MSFLPLVFIFLLGLLVGSFLNLVIDRIPREEQILKGRSRCDSCGKILAWYDLIPLVSWIFLGGRCGYCHSPIPWRNVVVEVATGLLFVSSIKYQVSGEILGDFTSIIRIIEVLSALFVISSLIAIFFIDFEHKIISDKIVYPAIIITLINLFISHTEDVGKWIILSNAGLSALGAGGFFLLLVLITRGKGMGMGDVKLAFLMGLFLGFPKIIYALYFAFLTGALISVILILLGKKKFGQTIAFGPFLVAAALFFHFNILNLIAERIW